MRKKPRAVNFIAPLFNPILLWMAYDQNNMGMAAMGICLFWITWRDRSFTMFKQKEGE